MGTYSEYILLFLKERPDRKFTAAQIVYFLSPMGLSESVVFANLKKMRDSEEIGCDWSEPSELSGHSRRYMLYYFKMTDKD